MRVRPPKWSPEPDRFELITQRAIADDARVWSGFVLEMFFQSSRPGCTRLSAKKAVEDARDRLRIHFNNVWSAELARAFIRTYPELGDFVETRGRPVTSKVAA